MAVYRLPLGYAEWPEPEASAPHAAEPLPDLEPVRSTRLLVSLPAALRRKIDDSAALEGVPADVWVSRALARSVDPRLDTP
jgi:hypothetical protein